MRKTESQLTPEKITKRIEQAREMEEIWKKTDEPARMYLIGCIVTAKALTGSEKGR